MWSGIGTTVMLSSYSYGKMVYPLGSRIMTWISKPTKYSGVRADRHQKM